MKLREDFFRRHHREGFSLWGYPSEKYDVREAYERARREHDPLLSPHGFFRSLAPKNNLQAREFLELLAHCIGRRVFSPFHVSSR